MDKINRQAPGVGVRRLQGILKRGGACIDGRELASGRTLAQVWRSKKTKTTYLAWWLVNICGVSAPAVRAVAGFPEAVIPCICGYCIPGTQGAAALRATFRWDGSRKKGK